MGRPLTRSKPGSDCLRARYESLRCVADKCDKGYHGHPNPPNPERRALDKVYTETVRALHQAARFFSLESSTNAYDSRVAVKVDIKPRDADGIPVQLTITDETNDAQAARRALCPWDAPFNSYPPGTEFRVDTQHSDGTGTYWKPVGYPQHHGTYLSPTTDNTQRTIDTIAPDIKSEFQKSLRACSESKQRHLYAVLAIWYCVDGIAQVFTNLDYETLGELIARLLKDRFVPRRVLADCRRLYMGQRPLVDGLATIRRPDVSGPFKSPMLTEWIVTNCAEKAHAGLRIDAVDQAFRSYLTNEKFNRQGGFGMTY